MNVSIENHTGYWVAAGAALMLAIWPARSNASLVEVAAEVAIVLPIAGTPLPDPSLSISGVGVAVVNGSGGQGSLTRLSLPSGLVATTSLIIPITDPFAAPVNGIQATLANGAGVFLGSGGFGSGFGGIVPLRGAMKVCLFSPCSSALANLSIPLSVIGIGGTTTVSALVNVTVRGNPWTTGYFEFGTVPFAGFAHGPASVSSSAASVSGFVRLGTPVFLSTSIGTLGLIPMWATADIHIGRVVPEPSTIMLIGSGIACFVLFGRETARKR